MLADLIDPDQAEPISALMSYVPNSAVLIESDLLPPEEVTTGELWIAATSVFPDGSDPWLGAVEVCSWAEGSVDGEATRALGLSNRFEGSWFRLQDAPASTDAAKLWRTDISTPEQVVNDKVAVAYQLMLFPEEHAPGRTGTGAALLTRLSLSQPRATRRLSGQRGPIPAPSYALVRTSRVGANDRSSRVPELDDVSLASILIVGCGALGSLIAEQLARAGVGELILVDGDVLDAGNLVRHSADIFDVGLTKASAVGRVAKRSAPGISVEVHEFMVGRASSGMRPLEESPMVRLTEAVERSHVVIDATAEIAVHEVLSKMALARRTTLVVAEGSPGAWGGTVATIPAGASACGNCLEFSRQGGLVPSPPANSVRVQPIGCSEPTFTGAGYDLAEVALQAVRATVSEVRRIDPAETVIDIVELRDPSGVPVLPRWNRVHIARREECEWH